MDNPKHGTRGCTVVPGHAECRQGLRLGGLGVQVEGSGGQVLEGPLNLRPYMYKAWNSRMLEPAVQALRA